MFHKNVEQYIVNGIEFRENSQFEEAIKSFEQALKYDQGNFRALMCLAGIYSHRHDYGKAISFYDRALEINSSDFGALNNRALAYYFKGDKEQAHADFKKILTIDPDNFNVKENIKSLFGDRFIEQTTPLTANSVFRVDPTVTVNRANPDHYLKKQNNVIADLHYKF